jgi:DinB superfamily
MDRIELTALIRTTSAELELLLSRLTVAEMNQPGAVGVWSVKDVLAHIAFWEHHAVRILKAVRCGETPDLDAEDSTESRNASVVAQYYLTPMGAVIASWNEAREDLLDQLADLSEADLNDSNRFPWNEGRPLLERIAANSYEHEREHIEQIREWMRGLT